MTDEGLEQVIKTLAKMAITAQKEARIAQALARLANPEVPEQTRDLARREIGQPFDELLRQLDATPALDALELLRRFEGPIQ